MLSAFIFDLDGTLVDLFDLHLLGFQEVSLEGWDLQFLREDLSKYYGRPAEDIARPFFEKHGISGVDYGDFARKRRAVVMRNLKAGYDVKVLPGATELLSEIKSAGLKLGLATSSTREMGEAMLKSAGIYEFFSARVYREDVKNGKPAPDIFLKTAELLGAKPPECAVVEDSVYGIQAAKAVGMKTIAVATGTQTKTDLEKLLPDILLGSLKTRLSDIKAQLE